MRSRVRMMDISFLVFLLCFLLVVVNTAKTQPDHLDEECKPRSCNSKAPSVQFPFWLNNHQSQRCGFPGFRLSCNNNNQTELEIPRSVRLTVDRIDYKRQQIHVHDAENCLTNQIKSHNISSTPYLFQQYPYSYTLFNCSSTSIENLVPCLSGPGFQVRAVESDNMIYMSPLLSCKKVHDIALIPVEIVSGQRNSLVLNWINPKCGQCSREGKECRLKRYGTMTQAECYHKPKQGVSKVLIIGVPVGSFLSVLLATGIYFAVRVRNLDQREKENQVRIEKFLEDYKALRPTRYSYADIKRITNQFKKKLGQGAYGTVFKGKLSDDVFVAAKILNYSAGDGEEFINEVRSMGTIHHVNVTRLVGFCADGMKRALVYEFLPNNSLEKYIFSADGKRDVLGWEKLQDIALGIAKGIEYLHQGCDQRILHFDIKPHNILLDHNYNPKISDFGQAKLCSKEQSAVSMTAARGTMGYIAPEVLSRNFGNVSCKSDVYSYGMLLLEIVGGRKNVDDKAEGASQIYFPEWIYKQLMDQGEDLGIGIQEESHGKIARKLAVIGLYCIQWYPVERPSMSTVVQMLKGEGESLTIPPNPFASTDAVRTANNPSRNFQSELETIPESG